MLTLLSAILAFGVALVVTVLVERHAVVLGLIDRPNDRSSHVHARPRGGGLGIVAGVCAGFVAVVSFGAVVPDGRLLAVLAGAAMVAAVGLLDDRAALPPGPRLLVQVGAAGLVAWAGGGFVTLPLPAPFDLPLGAIGVGLAVVWMVGVTNFFNFMDGADGLAGGQACLSFAALAVVLWPSPAAVLAVLAMAATAGFLVRNWAPARIFLGDVGSGWLGFALAAWPFAGPVDRREGLALLVATSLALFLLDPAVTLVRRWWRGASVMASHREHLYQQLFAPGHSHAWAVSLLLVGSLALVLVAVGAYRQPALGWLAVASGAALFAVEWLAAVSCRQGNGSPGRRARGDRQR